VDLPVPPQQFLLPALPTLRRLLRAAPDHHQPASLSNKLPLPGACRTAVIGDSSGLRWLTFLGAAGKAANLGG
jgi:hypothetical protein